MANHQSSVRGDSYSKPYLKFMPQSIDLAASVSTRLAVLANVGDGSDNGHKKKSVKARSASKLRLCDLVVAGYAESRS